MNFTNENILAFLEGKTSNDQSKEIKAWLKDPSNEAEVRKVLAEIWSRSDIKLKGEKPDFDVLFKKVQFRLGIENQKKQSSVHKLYHSFSRIAAILILPIILLSAYLLFDKVASFNSGQSPLMHEVYTKPGTSTKLELSDGTKVWLNNGTSFRYPEKFDKKERRVFVDGEAYFEVQSDKKHPFYVENSMMTTVVTGTHFNLYAYSADKLFEASLIEGQIRLEGKAGIIHVNPGEKIQFDTSTNKIFKQSIKNENAWIDGKLVIHNEKLDMAVRKLSRWYNADFLIADDILKDYDLTCTLEHEKIDQCMELISQALPIKYKIEKYANQKQTIRIMMK